MDGKYILALDQGTTSSRAVLFDRAGNVVSVAQKEFQQIYPKPGWVEHDPQEIWSTQAGVAAEAVRPGRTQRRVDRRHRHHQPARNHHRVGPRDRASGI